MNLSHLRYFVELVNTGHYTKAAKNLCITQPSLSHAISQLEEELGVPLFEKNGRNTTLTRFGELFLTYTTQALSTLDEGIDIIKKEAQGEGLIRLGFILPLGINFIPKITSEFLRLNKDKDIRFTFTSGVTGDLLDKLSSNTIDLAFCSKPREHRHLGYMPVLHENMVLIVSQNHPLASRYTVSLRETLSYKYIFFSKGSGMRGIIDDVFKEIGEFPEIAYEVDEDRVIAGLVAQNFGIAIISYSDLLIKLNLKIIPISDISNERTIYMVHDDSKYMSESIKKFHQFVLDKTKAL